MNRRKSRTICIKCINITSKSIIHRSIIQNYISFLKIKIQFNRMFKLFDSQSSLMELQLNIFNCHFSVLSENIPRYNKSRKIWFKHRNVSYIILNTIRQWSGGNLPVPKNRGHAQIGIRVQLWRPSNWNLTSNGSPTCLMSFHKYFYYVLIL